MPSGANVLRGSARLIDASTGQVVADYKVGKTIVGGRFAIVVMADPDRELHPSVLVYMPNRKDPQEYTLAEGSRIILGSPTDQVSRAMEVPDGANPWSTKFHVDERPINEAWPSKTKKESKDKTVFLSTPVKVTKGITVTKIPRSLPLRASHRASWPRPASRR